VTVEVGEIIGRSDHCQSHNNDPHGVHDIALDRPVHEYTVTDQIVVVEVSPDDCRTEVDDKAPDVDHHYAEDDAAEAAPPLRAYVVLAERVRLATDHRDDVKA